MRGDDKNVITPCIRKNNQNCFIIYLGFHFYTFFFFWLDPLCASPFGPLCNTSGEAGIRGMPCGFMFCMSHSD